MWYMIRLAFPYTSHLVLSSRTPFLLANSKKSTQKPKICTQDSNERKMMASSSSLKGCFSGSHAEYVFGTKKQNISPSTRLFNEALKTPG